MITTISHGYLPTVSLPWSMIADAVAVMVATTGPYVAASPRRVYKERVSDEVRDAAQPGSAVVISSVDKARGGTRGSGGHRVNGST